MSLEQLGSYEKVDGNLTRVEAIITPPYRETQGLIMLFLHDESGFYDILCFLVFTFLILFFSVFR